MATKLNITKAADLGIAPAPTMSQPSAIPTSYPEPIANPNLTATVPLGPIPGTMVVDMKVSTPAYSPPANMSPINMMELDKIGAPQSQAIGQVTDELTKAVRANDLDEIGKNLGDILVKAKELDPKSLSKPGFFGFFKRKTQQVANKFTSVSTQLQQLTTEVDGKITHFRGRVGTLQRLYEQTHQFHDDIGTICEEMDRRIQWMKDNAPVVDPADAFSAQERQKWDQTITMAEKRTDDLRRVQMLAQQQGPQIQLMIVNSVALAQKFDDVKTTTLPAWKNLFSLYILQLEQKKGAEMALAIDDATSKAIRSGADMLAQNTTMIHTALNQSAIKFEDLKYNQEKLFESIETAQRLAEAGRQRRAAERPQIEALSKELMARVGRLQQPAQSLLAKDARFS